MKNEDGELIRKSITTLEEDVEKIQQWAESQWYKNLLISFIVAFLVVFFYSFFYVESKVQQKISYQFVSNIREGTIEKIFDDYGKEECVEWKIFNKTYDEVMSRPHGYQEFTLPNECFYNGDICEVRILCPINIEKSLGDEINPDCYFSFSYCTKKIKRVEMVREI